MTQATFDDKVNRGDPYTGVPREKDNDALADFESKWKQVSLLRPHHKKGLKVYWSLKSGRDGSRLLCTFCGKEFAIAQTQIHHKDHDRRNNQLSNLAAACESCNNDEKSIWMSDEYRRTGAKGGSVITPKEKEKATETLEQQLLKQAPSTFQHSKRYKQQTLDHLVEYVNDSRSFDQVVADVEARTGCSHQKAIEYLNGYSLSSFAGWRQWFGTADVFDGKVEQWIAPRAGSEAYLRAVADFEQRKKGAST